MARTKTPQVKSSRATLDRLAADLRAQAEAALATRYPQYRNHWDDHRVVEVTRRVRTKLGVAFEPGDLVLCAPDTRTEPMPPRGQPLPYDQWPTVTFATCYSYRNQCDTMIPVGHIREVLVDG